MDITIPDPVIDLWVHPVRSGHDLVQIDGVLRVFGISVYTTTVTPASQIADRHASWSSLIESRGEKHTPHKPNLDYWDYEAAEAEVRSRCETRLAAALAKLLKEDS